MTNLRTILIIQQTVEDYFLMRRGETNKKTRLVEIVQPRQIAQYFAVEYLDGYTIKDIGQTIGNTDRTTVYNSVNRVKGVIEMSRTFKWMTDQIDDQIKDKLHDINHVLS